MSNDTLPVIEGTLRLSDGPILDCEQDMALVIPSGWDGARVRVMRREGHAAEWIVIERGRE